MNSEQTEKSTSPSLPFGGRTGGLGGRNVASDSCPVLSARVPKKMINLIS